MDLLASQCFTDLLHNYVNTYHIFNLITYFISLFVRQFI